MDRTSWTASNVPGEEVVYRSDRQRGCDVRSREEKEFRGSQLPEKKTSLDCAAGGILVWVRGEWNARRLAKGSARGMHTGPGNQANRENEA